MSRHPILVVTAVPAEADALRAALDQEPGPAPGTGSDHPGSRRVATPPEPTASLVIEAVGVGPAAAAAGTARLLARRRYRAVISAGIAGGFPGRADVGGTVLAGRTIAADLGAESPDGFLPVEELGFGSSILATDPALLEALRAALPHAAVGDILTLSTVTGTEETAARLAARFPRAVAEAMEGYGVAVAAADAGVPFAELRSISNPVGPRDRATWRLADAFAALRAAAPALHTLP
ncbi:futalosine hydrolase [Actinoplanes teichomyceticus]|uniref:Futalosine hydrolase n=1 Tax=Actinoplanes teichomyceticus TaxID=1867 RepID=A0A561WSH1_ACTTI|nr:futalosine hydrolase [Actinoplanes teichomyceticus]TWG26784.1 futalosine hydrolase [Actinoplanes teichomyceticus]GIF15182.1 Futalosine hydrolase [Actinoplanes teichomyceticus]